MLSLQAEAQSTPGSSEATSASSATAPAAPQAAPGPVICTLPAPQEQPPNSPGQPSAETQAAGSIHGTVTDSAGNLIAGAQVVLEGGASKAQQTQGQQTKAQQTQAQQTQVTDGSGAFRFTGLGAGTYHVTIASKGFATQQGFAIEVPPGESCELPAMALQISTVNTNVDVVFPLHELAQEEVKSEEKQRILGVLPNFYASYNWNAVPLTSGQKFHLALRSSIDPVSILIPAGIAGVQQWQNDLGGYGQGAQGYAKRFGADYGGSLISTMIGGAILPSVLHQDPRYFYKGTGSVFSRAIYAISFAVICRGDNGRRQPNYSNIFGSLAAAGISNAYYPSSDQHGAQTTVDNALIGIASGAASVLIQEFVMRKISRGVQVTPKAQP